jgi:hypothetical protein
MMVWVRVSAMSGLNPLTRETSRLLHESRPRPRRCPGSHDDVARDGEDTLLAEFGPEAREPRHQDAMDRPTKISHDLK